MRLLCYKTPLPQCGGRPRACAFTVSLNLLLLSVLLSFLVNFTDSQFLVFTSFFEHMIRFFSVVCFVVRYLSSPVHAEIHRYVAKILFCQHLLTWPLFVEDAARQPDPIEDERNAGEDGSGHS